MQGFDARLDIPQLLRIELHPRGVLAQLTRRFTGLRLGGFEQIDDRPETRIVLRQRAQPAGDGCELRQGRLATLAGLLGQSAAAAFNASPMLIRLSAITPSPTQRFMPSSPL